MSEPLGRALLAAVLLAAGCGGQESVPVDGGRFQLCPGLDAEECWRFTEVCDDFDRHATECNLLLSTAPGDDETFSWHEACADAVLSDGEPVEWLECLAALDCDDLWAELNGAGQCHHLRRSAA